MVRGSERLATRLSELAGLVLAGQLRFEQSLRLINKRLLLAKAFCVFAGLHAPFVFVLDLIKTFDVLVKELRLTRYALRAAIKAPL